MFKYGIYFCSSRSLGTIEMDFGKFFEKVDKEKFTWVAWDPPGYGKSRPPPRDFTGSYGHRDGITAGKMMEVNLSHEYYFLVHTSRSTGTDLWEYSTETWLR